VRRTKIVATLGPATSTAEQIIGLIESGVDVVRLNLSHGDHPTHAASLAAVRHASDVTGRAVGVLADLQGPKIRLGVFPGGPVLLTAGDRFTITTRDVDGTAQVVSTGYAGLPGDVRPGDPILIDDGRVALEAVEVTDTDVLTTVIEGGRVSDHKGVNLPGAAVSVPALTDKDVADLRWALAAGVDLLALSFVRHAADVAAVHAVMDEVGRRVPVLAKIEKPQAVEHLAEIIAAFDGLMIARGDLGVEMPLEQVPLLQWRAVAACREAGKPVIVATQMLESMIGASRPTRAEASDVANAVLDGTDAVMLSGETSVGRFPLESVTTMGRIVQTVDEEALSTVPRVVGAPQTKGEAIAKAAVEIAATVNARFLVAFTETGTSARLLAMHRPAAPLLAFTPRAETRSQLALTWGVETFLVPPVAHTDEMVRQVDAALIELGRCEVGDHIVIVAGSPPGISGSTNATRVHRVGDAVGGVAPAYQV
jgi:pyruvate kinase